MAKPLSNVQLEILQSFDYELDEEALLSFREMLVRYFSDKISDDMDLLFDEKSWDDAKNDEWSSTHLRKPYKRDN